MKCIEKIKYYVLTNFIYKKYCKLRDYNKYFCWLRLFLASYKLKRKYYSNKNESARNDKKLIIYMCDGRDSIRSGFADKFRGAISMYQIAKQMGYDYKIHFTVPFDLSNVLIPNKVDWVIDNKDISYNYNDSIVYDLQMIYWSGIKERVNVILPKLFSKPYKQIHIYTADFFSQELGTYSQLFNELFKLNPCFEADLQCHLDVLGADYISVATRFGLTMGDFRDGCGKIISQREQISLLSNLRMQIEKIHIQFPDRKILITSDSQRFINYIREELNYTYSQRSDIIHTRDVTSNDFKLVKNTMIDFFLISKANHIIQLKSKEMYKGTFSESASYINNTLYEIREF